MHFDRHPRFDLQPQGSILARNVSTRSCPPRTSPPADLEDKDEGGNDLGEPKTGGMKLVKKKPRRRHTDDPSKECFTLKFDLSLDIDPEIVPAMKKKTLREVLGPVFERKGIELSQVDLFLDQSNTPLSLSFEAYRIGGRYLKVKARAGDELKVEQGVKDLRSLSLPIMKPVSAQSPYILTPGGERPEAGSGSLGRCESLDLLGQARRRKNMTEFLGDASIPSPDSLAQLSGSLPCGTPLADSWKNRAAIRFSGFFSSTTGAGAFGKEGDRLELLQNKLHSYTLFGLPKIPPQLSFHQDSWEEEEVTNLTLEDSWQQLLENPEILSRRQFHQQEAIWELLQTEASYIKKLRVITDLFLCGLLNLQESGLLNEVEPMRLFSNIQDILRLHTTLWAQVMLPALEKARQAQTLLNPMDLHQGFKTFGSRFQPYIRYCMEEESCMEYMRSLLRDNELFRIYVTWAETNKQCNRLKLADMLAKPHQRLTKYPLLLKSVLKKTDDPSARDSVSSMVASVEGFINSVDSQMCQRQEQQKLATISNRIDSYEVVEGSSEEVEKILREFNCFDLMSPMKGTSKAETRQLHLEGALRMKEGKESRMEVYCFLFTDLLLITKPVKRLEKVKVIRQPLLMHHVVCKELKDPGSFVLVYLNEFKIAVAAYTFQANSAPQGRSWVDAICNLQKNIQRLRSEESLRQQRLGKEGEGEDGDESINSTSSSPYLQHKNQQGKSLSDGSTETLLEAGRSHDSSAMDSDPCGPFDSSIAISETGPEALNDQADTPLHGTDQNHLGFHKTQELDPQSRSLSMDSAYGTLSPLSILKELSPSSPGEGEETKEAQGIGFGERDKVELVEDEMGEKDEVEAEDKSFSGSQLSTVQSLKLRRHAPVQPRLRGLQRRILKSNSEDNLLQRFHEVSYISAETSKPKAECHSEQGREKCEGLSHSKSLSELGPDCMGLLFQPDPGQPNDYLNHSLPSGALLEAMRRSEVQGALPRLSDSGSQTTSGSSDDETAPSASREGKRRGPPRRPEEEAPHSRKSPAQQHKKLTLAQLYRIRTTLVLNSTLTASEV